MGRYTGPSTREALARVRESLGPDAVILATRAVEGGVEIVAAGGEAVDRMVAAAPGSAAAQATPPAHPPRPEVSAVAPAPAPSPSADTDLTRELMREVRLMRGMLEGELAGLAWGDMERREPLKVDVLRRLLDLGLSPGLARRLVDGLPAGLVGDSAEHWARDVLVRNLRVASREADLVEQGGVYALVGPTGSGKTTTVAKLGARCVLRKGAGSLALITTDSYRIGAHEQLRIYGKILGAPVISVRDEADLDLALDDLSRRHLVLIDTVGMSQRDRRIAEQVRLLCGDERPVQRLLLLSAPSQASTLEDVVRAYAGPGLAGCILTKIDEAMSLGAAVDAAVRHRLDVHFVTNGQRVPEDLHQANAPYIVDRTFRPRRVPDAFRLADNEYSLLMGQGG